MKKLFVYLTLLLAILMANYSYCTPWTNSQPVSKPKYHKIMKKWASYFVPYSQRYQLGMSQSCPSGYCVGSSTYFLTTAFSGNMSPVDVIHLMSIQGATNGTTEMNQIMSLQQQADQAFQSQSVNTFFAAQGVTSSLYPGTLPTEMSQLVPNYQAGQGMNSPNIQNQLTVTIDRIMSGIRGHFQLHPVSAVTITNIAFEYNRITRASINQLATGHMVALFRTPTGNLIFFDSNVGFGLFYNLDQFEQFFNEYYRASNRVSSTMNRFEMPANLRVHTNLALAASPNYQLCMGATSSSFRSSSSRSASSDLLNLLDFCTRKLTFKNVNYEDLSIQILLKHTTDVYFPNFEAGDELVFDYDQNADKYYYGGYEVQSIDLDEGRNPVGAFDQHDNMDFSWTSNSTITYKPRNLFNTEVLIDNYKESAHTQYREVRDADGINGGSANAIISSYRLGAREYIEVKKWGTKKMDLSKLETIRFKNASYDDIGQKRVRLGNNAWDLWPNLHQGTTIDFDYHGNGVVKHNGSILQQIDMYWTAPTTWYSGDELDFSWYNAQQINYRPYWSNSWNNIPTVTLVDFNNGAYSSYVDADGVQGYTPQMYMKVYVSEDQKVLNIELHGRAAYPNERHVMALVDQPVKEAVALRLMPNPTNSVLNVSVEGASSGAAYFIYDAMGRMVLQQSINRGNMSTSIDVSNLQSGLYYIVLPDEEGGKTQEKFIVAH
ncbi:T9SS type A sorting domain-containing protein [Aureispira anguillae]|uniref:T9SS type A sorting domain-containing protein n=1 Tax=Aureispira anguillae TaxID=2864201 RepID=A0A916DTG6_9BACT|nr:T9SS type A sorting domain-containing protein [Aureispira anguillae]BDS13224.1 T9SS type A sorting domain-containing protein [Aureispira anguillae]